MFDLSNRVAVITGGSSGLGKQMALGLAKQGAEVVLLARRKEKLEEAKKEIESIGNKCFIFQCDVTNSEEVNNVSKKVEKELGKVDILINCAGSSKNNGVYD